MATRIIHRQQSSPMGRLSLLSRGSLSAIGLCMIVLFTLNSPLLLAQQLSPSEAAAKARDFTSGKVLKVTPPPKGSDNYRVKVLLPKGRIRYLMVDGNSGAARFSSSKKK